MTIKRRFYYEGGNCVADITLTDYWGCTETDSIYNPAGVSAIFIHAEKGKAMPDGMAGLELTKTDCKHATQENTMWFTPNTKHPGRDVFMKIFATK